jgi:hypothetical protein
MAYHPPTPADPHLTSFCYIPTTITFFPKMSFCGRHIFVFHMLLKVSDVLLNVFHTNLYLLSWLRC